MQSQIGNYAKQCLGQGPKRFRFISRKFSQFFDYFFLVLLCNYDTIRGI